IRSRKSTTRTPLGSPPSLMLLPWRTSTRIASSPAGRFLFLPGSATDEVDGRVLVEAASPPGVLRRVRFATGERREGLDIVAPVVVEGVLAAGRAVEYTPPHSSPSARAGATDD